MSTRKVAMCARVFLRRLLGKLGAPELLREALVDIVEFLEHNARRANPRRDRKRGRLSAGLAMTAVPEAAK